jgi:hypothetical protein
MFKKLLMLCMVIALIDIYQVMGQDHEKSSSTPYAKIFSNFHTNLGNKESAFEIQRAYLGYQHKMNEHFSGDITFDVGISQVKINDTTSATSSLQMTAYLKQAALIYKNGKFKADMGMISLKQFKVQEKYWGFRYIEKSYQDLYGLSTSADLGASVEYQILPMLSADLTFRNGEGYKKMQSDKHFNSGLGLTFTPIKGVTLRGFYDYMNNKEEPQRTIAHFIGYQNNKISTGIEYNTQLNHKNKRDRNLKGYSIYSSFKINDQFKVFGRFDDLNSNELNGENTSWNKAKNGSFIISGVEYMPVKNIQLALNYQGWLPEDESLKSNNFIYLNLHYSF